MRALMFCIIWFSAPLHAWAQSSHLTPERTAELYYRSWLNYDRDSTLRLQREWGASSAEPRYLDMERVTDPVAWQFKYKMGDLPPGSSHEQAKLMTTLMIESSRRVRCKATTGQVGEQQPTGQYLARVKLECAVPEVKAAFEHLKAATSAAELGGREKAPAETLLRKMIAVVSRAPLTRRVSTEMLLTGDADKKIWRVGPTSLGIEAVGADFGRQLAQSGLMDGAL
jgi:hypothetical protein